MRRSDVPTFAAIVLLVAVSLRPYFDLTGGDFPFYLQAKAFAELRPDIDMPRGSELPTMLAWKDGRFFAHYPPGTSLLLAPFYAAGHALDRLTGGALGEVAVGGWREGIFAVVAVTAANLVFVGVLVWLVFRLADALGASDRARRRAGWLAVVGAPIWYLSGHPNTHVPSTMLTVASTVLVFEARRDGSPARLALAGLAGAVSFLVRPMNVLVLLPLGLYVLFRCPRPLRSAVVFGGTALAGPLAALALHAWMLGAPFENLYQHSLEFGRDGRMGTAQAETFSGFSTPFAEGLAGMLVGAVGPRVEDGDGPRRRMILPRPWTRWEHVRGLVFLMPMLAFAIPGFRGWARRGLGAEAWVVAAQLVLLLLAYSKWFFWYANPTTPLPSRFLCDAYPAWGLALATFLDEARGRTAAVARSTAVWSVANQAFVTGSLYVKFLSGTNLLHWPAAVVLALLAAASASVSRIFPDGSKLIEAEVSQDCQGHPGVVKGDRRDA